MNVFEYAASMEACFEDFMLSVGKERKTTFFADLSIAEWYGKDAVEETYSNVMNSWSEDLEFMCEWVVSLNQKIWQHHKTNPEIAKVYDKLWRKADEFCMNSFKGDELHQYLEYVD